MQLPYRAADKLNLLLMVCKTKHMLIFTRPSVSRVAMSHVDYRLCCTEAIHIHTISDSDLYCLTQKYKAGKYFRKLQKWTVLMLLNFDFIELFLHFCRLSFILLCIRLGPEWGLPKDSERQADKRQTGLFNQAEVEC